MWPENTVCGRCCGARRWLAAALVLIIYMDRDAVWSPDHKITVSSLLFDPVENSIWQKYLKPPPAELGFNILGSVLGGFLEYLSMIAGFRFLLLVALAAYGLFYRMFRSGGKAARCV